MKSLRVIFVLFLFFLAGLFSPSVFADSKTDYDYQYGQYRINYAQFLVLKNDYLSTPSLDNQQKVVLSAKQTILARDLAKASYSAYLQDLTAASQVNYAPIQPLLVVLDEAKVFFNEEAEKSQKIATETDVRNFTADYLANTPLYDSYLRYGVMANKIAALVRIQLNSQAAMEELIPKLPDPMPAILAVRIQELRNSSKAIDDRIKVFAESFNLDEAVDETANEIFFTQRVDFLKEIRALQLDWINRLIDIDINYVQI